MNYRPLFMLHPGYLPSVLLAQLHHQNRKLIKLNRPDYFDQAAACELNIRKRYGERSIHAAPIIDFQTMLEAQTFLGLFKILEPEGDGRIPIPSSNQQFWAHHKYSVMARDPNEYSAMGQRLAGPDTTWSIDDLGTHFANQLTITPRPGRLHNALLHMWGYLDTSHLTQPHTPAERLRLIQQLSYRQNIPYLLHSTALSDFGMWIN